MDSNENFCFLIFSSANNILAVCDSLDTVSKFILSHLNENFFDIRILKKRFLSNLDF